MSFRFVKARTWAWVCVDWVLCRFESRFAEAKLSGGRHETGRVGVLCGMVLGAGFRVFLMVGVPTDHLGKSKKMMIDLFEFVFRSEGHQKPGRGCEMGFRLL